jgi:hypothetical protein
MIDTLWSPFKKSRTKKFDRKPPLINIPIPPGSPNDIEIENVTHKKQKTKKKKILHQASPNKHQRTTRFFKVTS